MAWIKIFESAQEAASRVPPGTLALVRVGTLRICLANVKGSLRAVQDACTHNGEALSKGTVNFRGEVICPWHGYCFDLGSGRESGERSADLETFPIKAENDGIFIRI
ncbi:MAG TPA: Rieske (2Fe-2S) protein [Cytophagales bacterium]|nr:Rieske (2Fe-2S) protein [Cytophagales bacterium]